MYMKLKMNKLMYLGSLTLAILVSIGLNIAFPDAEQNTRADKVSLFPMDVQDLGEYAISAQTGTIAAGASANSPIFSFRWSNSSKVAVIKNVRIGAASLATGFTAGTSTCGLIFARTFTASDTGGTALTLTTNNAKKKTTFGTTLAGDIRISSTGALSAGTRTLDAQDLVLLGPFTTSNAVQTNFIPSDTKLWDADMRWPIVLVQDEGIIIRCTVPATGTWTAVVSMEWTERYRYPN